MDKNPTNFWLVVVGESSATVALVTLNGVLTVSSIGREIAWEDQSSLVQIINDAMSDCSQQNGLDTGSEPNKTAFIISPFWVAGDGRIIDTKLKLIENVCKELKLQPMGFMPFDEAIVEESNKIEGIPSSFVLVYVGSNQLIVSLSYLGKIKKRIKKIFSGRFDPILLESSLIEMNLESALPPLIKLSGQIDESMVLGVKNYPWIGKKNVETFLHFPEVQSISREELYRLYAKIIARQIDNQTNLSVSPDVDKTEDTTQTVDNSPSSDIPEISAEEFGFTTNTIPVVEESEIKSPDIVEPDIVETVAPIRHLPKIKLPSISLPKIKIHLPHTVMPAYILFLGLIIATLLLHYFSSAEVDLYLTPLTFSKKIDAIATANSQPSNKMVISAQRQSVSIIATTSISATGKKTIGDRARGEVVLYNKSEKPIKVSKGTLIYQGDLKFEFTNDTQVASSSSDLEKGIITLGQVKTQVMAESIGPESNLAKDSSFIFKDSSLNQLIVKSSSPFTGGNRQEISAVSATDKTDIEVQLDGKIKDLISQKINSEIEQNDAVLKGTIITKKGKIELNREIGEETETVDGSQNATITFFTISPEVKEQVIKTVLSDDPNYQQADSQKASYEFEFTTQSVTDTKAEGLLQVSGQAPPKFDQNNLLQKIKFTTKSNAGRIIRVLIPRTYKYDIKLSSISPLKLVDLLPLNPQNIKITVHSEPK